MARPLRSWLVATCTAAALCACHGPPGKRDAHRDSPPPGEDTSALCQDQKDNDGDGQTDCADPDCRYFVVCARGDARPEGPRPDLPPDGPRPPETGAADKGGDPQ